MTEATDAHVRRFASWVESSSRSGEEIEPDVVRTLLDCRDVLGERDGPEDWRRGDLRATLLDVIPAKVTADENWTVTVVPTTRLWLDFLQEACSPSTPIEILRDELAKATPKFGDAMADESKWGMGKRIGMEMMTEGVDVSDPDALERWMQEFNERPDDERAELTGGREPGWSEPDDPVLDAIERPIPIVVLPPLEELATHLAAARLVEDVVNLADWIGDRIEVTDTGIVRLAEGRRAAVELGLIDPQEPADGESAAESRSSWDIPGLGELWELAVGSGFIELSKTRAYPGGQLRAWRTGDDATRLQAWRRVFETAVDQPVDDHLLKLIPGQMAAAVTDYVLGSLYASEPLELSEVGQTLQTAAREQLAEEDYEDWFAEWAFSMVTGALERLHRLGAVQIADDETVVLTPLGTWAIREMLLESGETAPMAGELAEVDALTLVQELVPAPDDVWEAEWQHWLRRRTPDSAAHDLLAVAGELTPAGRGVLLGLLQQLDEEVLAGAREHAQHADPVVRRIAGLFLGAYGEEAPPDDDPAWLSVDRIAALTDLGMSGEEMLAELTDAEVPLDALAEQADTLARCSHPRTADVLQTFGRIVPDKQQAKALRKAAFRARSRAQ